MTYHIGNDAIETTETGKYRAYRQSAWWAGDYDTFAAARLVLAILNGRWVTGEDHLTVEPGDIHPASVGLIGSTTAQIADTIIDSARRAWEGSYAASMGSVLYPAKVRAERGDQAVLDERMTSGMMAVSTLRDIYLLSERPDVMHHIAQQQRP